MVSHCWCTNWDLFIGAIEHWWCWCVCAVWKRNGPTNGSGRPFVRIWLGQGVGACSSV